jgi:isocitrate/isopropylmalate dehydrogenase
LARLSTSLWVCRSFAPSVDHGTAFDIAGKGIAEHSSMVEAIKLAAELSLKAGESGRALEAA